MGNFDTALQELIERWKQRGADPVSMAHDMAANVCRLLQTQQPKDENQTELSFDQATS